MSTTDAPVEVVIASRDRREVLLSTLARVADDPAAPPVTVVDDGSVDGTAAAVAARFPQVRVLRLPTSRGAAARNVGVAAARAPLVAFSDDDSWWVPGALDRAVAHFEAAPRLGVLAARVLVGPERRPDPICGPLATSPLSDEPPLPGPRVLGFLACGAVVRRAAFLEVGGFPSRYGVGGEEELLAVDLADRGWWCSYAEDVVAVHEPPGRRGPARRDRAVRQLRNGLWSAWLRRPWPSAVVRSRALLGGERDRRVALAALAGAVAGLPGVLSDRRVVGPAVEADLQRLQPVPARGRGRRSKAGGHV